MELMSEMNREFQDFKRSMKEEMMLMKNGFRDQLRDLRTSMEDDASRVTAKQVELNHS